jgi:hypothetical protein
MYADTYSSIEIEKAYYAYVIAEVLFIVILLPLRNEIYEYRPVRISNGVFMFLFLCLIISSYPVLLIHSGKENVVKSGSLYLMFNILLLLSKQHFFSFRTFLHFAYLIIMISLGERVDSILAVVILLVINGDNLRQKEQYKKKALYMGLISLFSLAVIVRSQSNHLQELLISFYSQATVCDVLHVYLCSVKHYVVYGAEYSVLGNLFFGLFPGTFYGLTSNYNFTSFLNNNFVPNAGGGLFFSEGMLVFGPVGVILYMVLMAVLIKYLFKHKTRLHSTLFLLFMVMMCRIIWYGFIYTYKPVILCILSVIFFIKTVKSHKKNIEL